MPAAVRAVGGAMPVSRTRQPPLFPLARVAQLQQAPLSPGRELGQSDPELSQRCVVL